jgi:ADP-ribosylglycohydrolase
MFGAIAGDIIGSVFEHHNVKHTAFPLFSEGSRFTDDTVLTLAVAESIMEGKEYGQALREYGRRYPGAGYGGLFIQWLFSQAPAPYNSFGNGSAMRVSPVGFAYSTLEQVLEEAERSAAVTHNHPEGIKGAQATAAAIFLARQGSGKKEIRQYIANHFGYNLEQTLEQIRPITASMPPARVLYRRRSSPFSHPRTTKMLYARLSPSEATVILLPA